MLNGLIQDTHGRQMLAAHAIKGDRRYRYYVSKTVEQDVEQAWRLPAGDIETLVTDALRSLLRDPLRMAVELGDAAATRTTFASGSAHLAERIADASLLRQLGVAIVVHNDSIEVELATQLLASAIGADARHIDPEGRVRLSLAVQLKRRGHELRLVYTAPDANPAKRDDRLIRLIASGHEAWEELIAAADTLTTTRRSHLVRLARLRFLAPDIVEAIVDGRHPVELTSRMLLRIAAMPLRWSDQRAALHLA